MNQYICLCVVVLLLTACVERKPMVLPIKPSTPVAVIVVPPSQPAPSDESSLEQNVELEETTNDVKINIPTFPLLLNGLSEHDLTMLAHRASTKFPEPHWRVVADNSRYVRSRVTKVLLQNGLPEELQVIPAIESSYNPYEVSAAGASGLWQFMPSTARALGLQCTDRLNESRDVEKSTHAAARYLRQLQQRFDYWPLALAAYNCGPSRLASWLRKHGDWQPADGLDALPAPRASKAYVKNILSLAYAQYRGSLRFPQEMKVRKVISSDLNIRKLGKKLGFSHELLLRLNPQLERMRYQDGQAISLCIPDDALWVEQKNSTATSMRQNIAKKARVKVKKGDTLSSIAKRHHTSVRALRQSNPNLGRFIHPGQRLWLSSLSEQNPLCRR